ncbi:protein N-terminal asparagine amidohydrolase [Trichogramma pretiosum]|uniref:Protein N-terminal asparagine amidohydrolase n=1 Tax=Trichogramma kaykai TaxID=54128 RepID=A0ABD2W1H2_9HYME|nr:protein N-terminal asparagine amidohydrolase [Trichogramma pretiosum]XP_014235541.1 protein N-terminal asparagine amidohydrolase [Trichogramma pretiosum]XP_014235542.1 protein N-terminal asparagine amidohydrolase [Trichogramma pretiosum]XP_023314965.1 protein N-terminal asparagine amidohydrolase [Trichogramma pretiosum]
MVLVLNGIPQEEVPCTSRDLYNAHPVYRESANQLHMVPTKLVGPAGLLYVQQREMAATLPQDKNVTILGTDDVTTCVIVIVRHGGSGAVALSHLDGSGTEQAVCHMIARVSELSIGFPEGRIELQLIGGYADPRNYSEQLFHSILSCFHKLPIEIYLTLCCVGELNTTFRAGIHWPMIYGLGINVTTSEIFPATFPDKGPEQPLRSARHFTGGQEVLDIYDYTLGLLKIGPFNYSPSRGVNLWLSRSDQFILQHLSTSPDVEPPHFVSNIRATLKYIQENPFPSVTVFRDNKPHYYRRDEVTGCWQPIRY